MSSISRIARYTRPAVQTLFLAAFVFLFMDLAWPVSMPLDNALLAQDPLAAITSLIFHRGVWLPSALVLVTISSALLLGRAFCGWACPVGFLTDISGYLRKLLKLRPSHARLGFVQYGLLAAVLISSIFTLDVLSILDPFVIFQRTLDVLWSGGGIPIVILLLMAGSLIAPRLWCRICPAGAVYGLASIVSPFGMKISETCVGCSKCHKVCPMGAISKDLKWDVTACTRCLDCERLCPKGSIGFSPSIPKAPAFSASRRSFMAAGASLGSFILLKGGSSIATVKADESGLIRPPGSLVETRFNAACARCESCVKACPAQVIKPLPISGGLERVFTPALDFNKSSCERCGTCGQVCPTGAIISIPPGNMKIGTASIDQQKCIAWTDDAHCLICAEMCPVGAVKDINRLRPKVSPEICVGCGVCQLNCPARPEKAIVVSGESANRRE